jgi:benzoyl-CoA reductase/2-hydroxyglutaryl-CoA dehydratase subunit BcrC/BadD/HgdB
MLPQWHRGTEWARDAARAFHEEVEGRVAAGEAACEDERLRLMWIGRGLWFNLGFYQHFQREYGAVFVWSMYLAIAADGYPRYGGPALRALAARFAAFTDLLGMPGWAEPWYLKEAQSHGVDGVVHLVTSESRSSYFVTRTLEEAGIPVLEIDANNADARDWDEDAFVRELSEFIERRVA